MAAPRLRRARALAAALFVVALACEARDGARPDAGAAPTAPEGPLELVTGGARRDDALPLVVAIHGLGDTPHGFAALYEDFASPARVVLPGAPSSDARGASWFPLPWDAGEAAFEAGVAAAAGRLAEQMEALARERPTRGRPIVTGFSQGGILSFAVATTRSGAVSGAIPIGGFLPRRLWPRALPAGAGGVPIRALHGGRDELLPAAETKALVEHLRRIGFDAVLRVYPDVGHVVTGAMLRDYHAALADAVARAAAAP